MPKRNPLLAAWRPFHYTHKGVDFVDTEPRDGNWHKCAFAGTMLEQPLIWKDDAWCFMDFKETNSIVPHNPQPTHWLWRPTILIPQPPVV